MRCARCAGRGWLLALALMLRLVERRMPVPMPCGRLPRLLHVGCGRVHPRHVPAHCLVPSPVRAVVPATHATCLPFAFSAVLAKRMFPLLPRKKLVLVGSVFAHRGCCGVFACALHSAAGEATLPGAVGGGQRDAMHFCCRPARIFAVVDPSRRGADRPDYDLRLLCAGMSVSSHS